VTDRAILSADCNEPEGIVKRSVYEIELTQENLLTFWNRAKQFKTLFTKELDGFGSFMDSFVSEVNGGPFAHGLLWKVDDWTGAYYLTDIRPGYDALVHFAFFDGRLKGRQELTREMLRYVMINYKFHRLSALMPLYVKGATLRFANEIGMRPEGRIKKCIRYRGEWFDALIYGILEEEVLSGSRA
jgi:hypothetical protein